MNAAADNMARAKGDKATLIVGLGKTGLSCARFLAARGLPFAVADSRGEPPALEALRREMPDIEIHSGPFDPALFVRSGQLLLSPGVDPREPAVAAAAAAGVPVLGDIELFARHADAPVVAVTGSNGKSTVTALAGEMARRAGLDVRVGGNIGTPALDLLGDRAPDLYVLELSSFQLEVTESLNPRAAVVLNISPDHLDRHKGMEDYVALKARIFRGDGVMVLNADDSAVAAMAVPGRRALWFTLGAPRGEAEYGLIGQGRDAWLARGGERLLAAGELRLAGRHNQANALAALALAEAAGVPRPPALYALKEFPGLPHRCAWVARRRDVDWYNDSKGTNLGATLAALEGMPGDKVVLIAGGLGKGADFTPLRAGVAARARAVVLIGRDAPLIERALSGTVPLLRAGSMEAAVSEAASVALEGDSVLLSPACASFDMFTDYVARGDAFVAAVKGLEP